MIFSGLSNNIEPSEERWRAAETIRTRVLAMLSERESLADAEFGRPDGNWSADAPNDIHAAFRLLRNGGRAEMRVLRFRSQPFSGYNLMYMSDGAGLRCIDPVPIDLDARLATLVPDRWVSAWQQISAKVPTTYLWSPPAICGEIGWLIDGVIVNHDTFVYQERVNLLYESGALRFLSKARAPRILEIGGGYGALACALMSKLPAARYTICDLPESLLFAGVYTRLAGVDVELIPNYRFSDLSGEFDLVINTLSMSEMSAHQVRVYASGISRLIDDHGVFFEQNTDNRGCGMINCKDHLEPVFRYRREVPGGTQGRADLWANGKFEAREGTGNSM